MVRNFQIRNVRPCRPTRIWLNSTGPPSSSKITTAMTASSGTSSTSPARAASRSATALTACPKRPGMEVRRCRGTGR
jgi:hypothetical protein